MLLFGKHYFPDLGSIMSCDYGCTVTQLFDETRDQTPTGNSERTVTQLVNDELLA